MDGGKIMYPPSPLTSIPGRRLVRLPILPYPCGYRKMYCIPPPPVLTFLLVGRGSYVSSRCARDSSPCFPSSTSTSITRRSEASPVGTPIQGTSPYVSHICPITLGSVVASLNP